MGKYVWWIEKQTDHLWVHEIYIKKGEWGQYKPSGNNSWGRKQICNVKDLMEKFIWDPNKIGYVLNDAYFICGFGISNAGSLVYNKTLKFHL